MPDTKNEDKPELTHEGLHDWGNALVEDGMARRNAAEGQWWENIATYLGDFWVQWDPHRRRLWEPVRKGKNKVRIPINLAQPVVRTEVAKLTKNRPITDVLAAGDDIKSINSAKVGDKMLNQYAERAFHLARVRRRALQWVTMCGSGGIFVDYDDTAQEAIEVYEIDGKGAVFDERVIKAYQGDEKKAKKLKKGSIPKGELRVVPVSPFNLIWDFSQIYPEDSMWMIVSEVYDCAVAEQRWGKKVTPDESAEPGVLERRMLQRMDLTQKLTVSAPRATSMCRVHRLFVKPGHPYFPEGAEIAFTKSEFLEGKNFPFRHKHIPVSMMGHIPLPTSQYSMSILQQIRGPVVELSKTESQMLENRNMAANPPWLEPVQARLEGEITNKPGLRLKYTHVPNVPPPQPVQMPDMPQYVKDLPEILGRHIQEISGQGDTSQGRVPPGARSGVAIAYLQEEDDTKLGPTVSEFEEMMERTNFQLLEVMAEKYDVMRTIRLYPKRGGEPEVFDFYGEMLSGCAGVEVQAGSALPRSKAAKQQFVLDLWDRKLEQDPRKVRQMLELSEGEPDDWEIDLDQAERENRKMEGGEECPVEEWMNHPAHLYQHHRVMKTVDWEEMDEDRKAIYTRHCEEHEGHEQQQKREQAMLNLQGGPGGGGPPAGNGQQVPEGAPEQFSGASPRSLIDDQPA